MKHNIFSLLFFIGFFSAHFLPFVHNGAQTIIREITHEVTHEVSLETTGAALPQAVAVFETSLASPISTSATSLTLTANSVRGGTTLSGYNCFTIDEGSAQAEFVCGTVSSTAVTSLTRGVNPSTGTTTVTALKFAHRRGANVKITDFPVITIMRNQLNGIETIPNALRYANTIVDADITSATTSLVSYNLLANSLAAGAVNGSTIVKGIFQLATAQQEASSTSLGSTLASLVMGSGNATDTPQSGCAAGYTSVVGAGCTVIAGLGGKISTLWINLTSNYTWTGAHTFTATTTASSGFVADLGWGGDGSDGDVTISAATTTLTRDMYYRNLTITSAGQMDTGCFKIFVKQTATINGLIAHNGNVGGNGVSGCTHSAGAGGAAGTVACSGTSMSLKTIAGAAGGAGSASGAVGTDGSAGSASSVAASGSTGAAGSAGGIGGSCNSNCAWLGGQAGGGGGVGGAITASIWNPIKHLYNVINFLEIAPGANPVQPATSGGTGGSGGGAAGGSSSNCISGEGAGGGGGGSGSVGGTIVLIAQQIQGNGTIMTVGGKGGNGGNGGNATCANSAAGGGGGAGSGGNGGLIVLGYASSSFSGSLLYTGGLAGSVGTAGTGALGGGASGSTGSTGTTGNLIQMNY